MALFAFIHAFGQTQDPDIQVKSVSSFVDTTFSGRQLRYAARREYYQSTNAIVEDDGKITEKSLFLLIFGEDFDKIYSKFQNYCISSYTVIPLTKFLSESYKSIVNNDASTAKYCLSAKCGFETFSSTLTILQNRATFSKNTPLYQKISALPLDMWI